MNVKELRRYLAVIKRSVSYIEAMLENDDEGMMEDMMGQHGGKGFDPRSAMPNPVVHNNPYFQPHPHAIHNPMIGAIPSPYYMPNNLAPFVPNGLGQIPQVFAPAESAIQITERPTENQVGNIASPESHNGFASVVIEQQYKSAEESRAKHVQELLAINDWPDAVPSVIAGKEPSETDQINRAKAVLDSMLSKPIKDLDFLDYGCGQGWIVAEAAKLGAKSSTGFDIEYDSKWREFDSVKFTTQSRELIPQGYDVIMLYDVLDHCEDPVSMMRQIKTLLKADGSLHVRCHPWTSRHGAHLFKKGLNKAYIHLFLKYEEIVKAINNEAPMYVRTEKAPLEAYDWWFNDFEVCSMYTIKEPVPQFFLSDSFKSLLKSEMNLNNDQLDGFLELMEIQFIDFSLRLKKS